MELYAIEECLRGFLAEAIRDDSGRVPDVTVDITWPIGKRGILLGQIPEGESEPVNGIRTLVADVGLTFGAFVPERIAEQSVTRLVFAFEQDPTLGGRLGNGNAALDQPEPVDGDDRGDWTAKLTARIGFPE